ncbi:MAG: efflux transporter, RND family, MFP subunit, partial [uncultured bacterium]
MLFKKKYTFIETIRKYKRMSILVAILFVGGIVIFATRGSQDSSAEAGDTQKPVSLLSLSHIQENQVVATASGEIESLEQVTLSSEMFGTVSRVYVVIGDKVKAGQLLLQFKANDRAAQYTQTQADYENALASKNSLLAQIDVAYANHEKLKINVASSITSAESALRMAENNLQQVANTGSNAIVDDAYADLVQTVHSDQDTFVDMLVVADTILGIDNQFANDAFEDILGILNSGSLSIAKQNYYSAKNAKENFHSQMIGVNSASSKETIDAVALSAKETLSVYAVLFASLTTLF